LTNITAEKLENIYSYKKVIDSFYKNVETAIYNRLAAGEEFEGIELKECYDRKRFAEGKKEKFEKFFKSDDIYKPVQLKSIGDLTKLVGKDKIAPFLETPKVKKIKPKEKDFFKKIGSD